MRKICVVTGSRADYGHLYWLLREIDNDPELKLQIVATGAHLSEAYGHTVDEIEGDGFRVDEKVRIDLGSDSPVGIAHSMGQAVAGIAESLERLQPHIVVLLGDRFEALAAAQAAMVARIPIAHLHGGEATEGLIDEAIRHSITKMAHLHFVAAEPYARRVVQLGEQPDRVFTVGAPGLDHITKASPMTREGLEESLSFKLGSASFLVTYHPVTLREAATRDEIDALLAALMAFSKARIVFTGVNADTDNHFVAQQITEYVNKSDGAAVSFTSLGHHRYLSMMRVTDVVIGNSSGGVIEAPALRTASVDIGERQRGRLKAASVISCDGNRSSIEAAISKALSADFQSRLNTVESPYGSGNASHHIMEALKTENLDNIVMKSFYDLTA